jgi:two-component system, cell cycle response regulator
MVLARTIGRLPLPLRVVYAVLALGLVVYAAHVTFGFTPVGGDRLLGDDLYTALMVGPTLLCLARAVLIPRERLPWLVLGIGLVGWTVGDALWSYWLDYLDDPPFPSIADAAYLVYYVLAYVAFVLLLRARLRPFRLSLSLDGIVAALGVSAVAVAVVFPFVLDATQGNTAVVAVSTAYPAGDAVLLAFTALAFALTGWRPGRAWILLGGGTLLTAVVDCVYQVQESLGQANAGDVVAWMWPAGALLVSLAAWQPPGRRVADDGGRASAALSVGFGAIALAVLAYGQVAEISPIAGLLAVGAVAAALARGGIAFRENLAMTRRSEREARTDALSGLGNRRRLMDELDVTCAEERTATLVFFDLDGFKLYNDSFGHAAGDELLARLARSLTEAVGEHGAAFRLGGDEFCVLLDGTHERDGELLGRIAASLSEPGDLVQIAASVGLVALPVEAATPADALLLADQRMYADKAMRRPAGAGRRQVELRTTVAGY